MRFDSHRSSQVVGFRKHRYRPHCQMLQLFIHLNILRLLKFSKIMPVFKAKLYLWGWGLLEEGFLLSEGVHRVIDEVHVDVDGVQARNAKLKKYFRKGHN